MTIHTNTPAIPITLLYMALWNVIRLLYVYAYISLSSYVTKLLVYTFTTTEVHIIWIYAKNKHSWKLGRKAPPPPRTGKFFLDQIYPFHAISSNFHSGGRKAPLPPSPPPPLPPPPSSLPHSLPFLTTSIPPPPFPIPPLPPSPSPRNKKIFSRLDLSISCNFQQLWFQVAEKPPPSFLPFHQRPGPGPYCTLWWKSGGGLFCPIFRNVYF